MAQREGHWPNIAPFRGTLVKGEWPTIPEILAITVSRFSERDVLVLLGKEGVRMTYRELARRVKQMGRMLVCRGGVKKGDLVLLTGKNSPYWVITFLAIVGVGAVAVPLDYRMDADEMERIAGFTEAKVFCADEEKLDVIDVPVKFPLSPKEETFDTSLHDKITERDSPKEDDLAAILFTSGTTGREKGVMLTHKNISTVIYQVGHPNFLWGTEKDIVYALLPLHHSFAITGVLLASVKNGAQILFPSGMAVDRILQDFKRGRVTVLLGIPMLYNKILRGIMRAIRAKGRTLFLLVLLLMKLCGFVRNFLRINLGKWLFYGIRAKASLSTIRLLVSGAAPLAPATYEQYRQLGLTLVQGYGLTETAPTLTLSAESCHDPRTVGVVLPLVRMKIVHPDERGVGEVVVKGPNICRGYYQNEAATAALFDEDGFLRTGDLGYINKKKQLYLAGRADAMLVTEGGKNIFPEEIEELFQMVDEVEQVMVRGSLTDGKLEIEILIYPDWTLFKENEDLKRVQQVLRQAVAQVNRGLPPYKRISRILILQEPMVTTTTKKVKRKATLAKVEEANLVGFPV